VLARSEVMITRDELLAVLDRFRGKTEQLRPCMRRSSTGAGPFMRTPAAASMFASSAAYRDRRLELEEFTGDTAVLFVECSKGTYIRALAEDIGAALGLRRASRGAGAHRGRRVPAGPGDHPGCAQGASLASGAAAFCRRKRCSDRARSVPLASTPETKSSAERSSAARHADPAGRSPRRVQSHERFSRPASGTLASRSEQRFRRQKAAAPLGKRKPLSASRVIAWPSRNAPTRCAPAPRDARRNRAPHRCPRRAPGCRCPCCTRRTRRPYPP